MSNPSDEVRTMSMEELTEANLDMLVNFASDTGGLTTLGLLEADDGKPAYSLEHDCDDPNRAMLTQLYHLAHAGEPVVREETIHIGSGEHFTRQTARKLPFGAYALETYHHETGEDGTTHESFSAKVFRQRDESPSLDTSEAA